MEEMPNSVKISAKPEFVEQKTDYQVVFFTLKGVDGYYAYKVKNDVKISLGKEVDLYIPYQRISFYDQDNNKLNSREIVYPNEGKAIVKNVNGKMIIKAAGATLEYPENPDYPDGEYMIRYKQDKLQPIYTKKMVKKGGYENPVLDNPKNTIKVSAYDEDVLGQKLLAYVEVKEFEKYASFVVKNNFSVYKMPVFELYVPEDGFELIK